MTRTPLIAFSLAALVAAPCLVAQEEAPAQDKQLLRYEMTKGAKYRLGLTQQSVATRKMGGEEMSQDFSMTMVFDIEVLDAAEGEFQVGYTNSRLMGRVIMPQGAIEFDSDDRDNFPPMMMQMLGPIGHQVIARIDARGEFLEVTVPDGMETPPGADMAEEMKSMLKAFVPTLPEEAVAVGGSWEKEDSMNVGPGRDAKVVNRYTLRDVEDGAVTIASTVEFEEGTDFSVDESFWTVDLKRGGTRVLVRSMSGKVEQDGISEEIKTTTSVSEIKEEAKQAEPEAGEGDDEADESADEAAEQD